MKASRRLLRYPLLLDAVSRDRIYLKLKQAGLGPSILYPASLSKIDGLAHIIEDKRSFPNAEMFASQLITLPTHSSVNDENIEKMMTILNEA
jgi:dTDP-4-amino-4,6-dideoxygalactose transaminase